MATKLASGYIDLSVHYAQAMKEVQKAFRDLEIDFTVNSKPAERQSERYREKESKKPVETKLDVDLREAEKKLLGLRIKEEGRKLGLEVDVDTAQADVQLRLLRAQAEARRIELGVDVDTRAVGGLRRELENLRRSDFLKINLGVIGIASLPAMAAGLAEVASAMQQLSQAALAVPGGIAGVVSSVGTLAFGVTGVADAYEALNKAADDNAKSGRDVANQARSQQSASYSLRNAIVDEEQARNDVNRAIRDQKRELQDLALEQRGGVVSEKRAVLDAQKARERLYSGDFSDYREALLDVEEADLRIEEVRNRNVRTTEDLAEANAKGVAGSDRVVAANERLVRSQQGVVSAQGAVAAAAATTSAAQEDADLAMSKLAPNAQEFVRALMDVQGPIQSLRNLVQNRIFDGLAGELKGLTATAMPTFEHGLGGIGDAWNKTFREVAKVAGDKKNLGILDRIFGNTAAAQNILTGAIDPLTDGLLTLTEAGTDALPRLADGFVAVSERFANFISEADADGRLDEWIDEGITAMGHLGEIVLNVGKMFTGIGDAADGTLLENLEKWTTKWAEWINSVEGQETLRNFFAEGKRVLEQWRPILEDVPGIFSRIYDAVSTFASGMSQVLSPVTEILENFPGLVETAVVAFLAFNSAKAVGAIAALMGKLTGLSTMLGTTLPADAKKGAGKINVAMSLIAVPMIGKMITDEIDEWLKNNHPDLYDLNHTNTPDQLGRRARQWVDENLLSGPGTGVAQGPLDTSGTPVLPGILAGDSPVAGPGQSGGNALDPRFFLGSSGGARSASNPLQDLLDAGVRGGGGQTLVSVPGTYGLQPGSNSGGYGGGGVDFPAWVDQLAAAFGIRPSTYGGHQESNRNEAGYAPNPAGQNRGIDWSGPVENMQKFADYLATVPGAAEQVIWQNPNTGAATEIAGGRPQPAYFSSDLGGHQNHVHTRQSAPLPLPPWMNPKPFDTGGWWKNGELGINTTGKDELVLNPDHLDQLAKQGVDPNTLLHGQSQGAFPGPPPELLDQVAAQTGVKPDEAFSGARTGGYIPAAAGSTSVAGESFLSGIYGMGAQVINGLIDQAASAAAGAAGAAATAFAPGSGGAASGLASAAIGMGTQAVKRGVEYGAQMLGIGTDALLEQLTPFGAPRILTTDPTGFMPQQMLSGVAAKMLMPGQQTPGQADPAAGGPPPVPHQGTNAAPGPTPPAPGPTPGVGQAVGQSTPTDLAALDFLKPIIPTVHDQGGWLPAGGVAINQSRKAEPMPVFNHDQWGTLNSLANSPVSELSPSTGGNDYRTIIESVTVKDVAELERQLEDRRRLNTMRSRGRPGPG